ncbi:hypothetical protein ACHAWC_004475 [Mediolabrus comicus]
MPKAKAKSNKSKKKASAPNKNGGGKSSITSGVANLSLSSPPLLNDVSPLILSSNAATQDGKLNFSLPYIGPIAAQQSQSVVHGRGLVVTRDVAAGECLFVIPSVAAAPMNQVYNKFVGEEEDYDNIDDNVDDSNLNKDGSYLETITEEMLIQQIQQLIDIIDDEEAHPKEKMEHAQNLLHAFITQMSSDDVPSTETDMDELMKTLLLSKKKERCNNIDFNKVLDRDTILNIIRRNAFGPDFHHYDKIASFWNTNPHGKKFYERLLGVYPLSAMINHSCSPNAVKVFGRIPSSCLPNGTGLNEDIQGREVMIVHANMAIAKGTEIMWSYIPPSNPLNERREALLSKFGFKCNCSRCVQEEEALNTNPLITSGTSTWDTIQAIEQNLSSNEIRISYATLYLQYFNTTIPSILHHNDKINDILKLATRLHFSFLSCNNS